MHPRLFLLLAALSVGCARPSQGARRGQPIDARELPRELVACRSLEGEENNQTEILATTLTLLNEGKYAARAGQETGVRVNPANADAIVFARQTRAGDADSNELYVGSLRGAFAEERLTRDGFADVEPCWSADGTRILFASNRAGLFQLWSIDADGGDLRVLSAPPTDGADRAPDARADKIVFSRITPQQSGAIAQLYIMNADGSGLAQLTAGTSGASGFIGGDYEPALSADASRVVFSRRTATDRASLYVVEIGTLIPLPLPSNVTSDDRQPRFLPGNTTLLATRKDPTGGLTGRRLMLFEVGGRDVAQLTLDGRHAYFGADVIPGTAPPPALAVSWTAAEFDDDAAAIVVGRRTLGSFELLRSKDGSGIQVSTVAQGNREVAGVFLPLQLPGTDPTQFGRMRLNVTFLPPRQATLRLSIYDNVRGRFDVAWEQTASAAPGFQDVEVQFASLAHVDKNRWVRVELAAEAPAGQRSELLVDSIAVAARSRQQ